MADNRPVLSKEQWQSVEADYKLGNYKSVTELAQRYNVKITTLHSAIKRFGWDEQRERVVEKVSKSLEKTAINEAESWKNRVKERTLKDWNIIDSSIDNVGSEVDPETLLPFIRGRKILDDMHRRALGLSDPVNHVDIKSGGLSLGESLISAIAKVRESQSEPKLSDADFEKIIEAEIVEE